MLLILSRDRPGRQPTVTGIVSMTMSALQESAAGAQSRHVRETIECTPSIPYMPYLVLGRIWSLRSRLQQIHIAFIQADSSRLNRAANLVARIKGPMLLPNLHHLWKLGLEDFFAVPYGFENTDRLTFLNSHVLPRFIPPFPPQTFPRGQQYPSPQLEAGRILCF